MVTDIQLSGSCRIDPGDESQSVPSFAPQVTRRKSRLPNLPPLKMKVRENSTTVLTKGTPPF